MLKKLKYQLKVLLPVEAQEPMPGHHVDNRFITLSLQRSGQHAVIHWLCTQIRNIVHFNHCHFERVHLRNWITPINNRVVYYRDSEQLDSGIQDRESLISFLADIPEYQHLLYSFEDFDIENALITKYVRTSNPTVILILRDPYNWLASSIKHDRNSPRLLAAKKSILVKYLEQALGVKNYLTGPVVVISYNQWVTQADYRRSICRELGVPFSETADRTLSSIQNFGGGSSFDGLHLDKDQLKSNVFQRWKQFASDPLYRELLDDDYLNELATRFFQVQKPF